MNIKINIKDCDCSPALITKKEISEVQFKKKNMLYAPPTKDKKSSVTQTNKKNNPILLSSANSNLPLNKTNNNEQHYYNNVNFKEAEKKLVQDLSQISKNQMTMDMIHNSNTVLQKQNEILESNQKTLHNLVSNSRNTNIESDNQMKNRQLRRVFEQSADKIAKEVKQIKKMRDQIIDAGQQFKKVLSEGKNVPANKGPQQIGQMNANLKNLVELSKNHIEGLQNLEGIKNLQNFNIEAYIQAVNTLKKQIVQYQKESENIERQLKLRSAKLQKLEISPNFDQQLLQPYEKYLKKKADSIDLHSLKQKVYEKLGVFDYGKFQFDAGSIMNQVKNQMNDFYIACKQYEIKIPDIKIDKKQLKQLQLNLPSVLDQYKQSKGIVLGQQNRQGEKANLDTKKSNPPSKNISKQIGNVNVQKKNSKKAGKGVQIQDFGVIYTKPVDYSTNVKLTRTGQNQYKSILQSKAQQQKKEVYKNVQKKQNPDDQFQKYLQNRAKQQLASIIEQKNKRLKQMEKQLYLKNSDQEPKYQLRFDVKNKLSPKKQVKKQEIEKEQEFEEYAEQFEEEQKGKKQFVRKEEKGQKKEKQHLSKEKQEIKNVGTEVLREKLKNLFAKNPNLNQHVHQNRLIQNANQGYSQGSFGQPSPQAQMNQMNSLAEGFINMINNTLTQVNNTLSQSIQKKIQNRSISKERKPEFQRRSPNKIVIPRLQQFRAPPVFNMQMVQSGGVRTEQKRPQKKIVAKNYDHLRIKQQEDDLEVSAMSFDD